MKNLQTVDEVVDFPHETLHKDHLAQANTHVPQFRGKRLHFRKIVQLHGSREVE